MRAGGRHPIQERNADGHLGLLGGEAACSQPRSDQRLVAAHRCFGQRALAIICCYLPGQPSSLRDHLEMPVTLCERTQFIIAVRRDHLAGGGVIICAVSRHPSDSTVNLIQQRRNLGQIVGVLFRESPGNYHAIAGIDHQMQFVPFPTRLRAAFRLQPLMRPVNPTPVQVPTLVASVRGKRQPNKR